MTLDIEVWILQQSVNPSFSAIVASSYSEVGSIRGGMRLSIVYRRYGIDVSGGVFRTAMDVLGLLLDCLSR